jgi:hypothetical protein
VQSPGVTFNSPLIDGQLAPHPGMSTLAENGTAQVGSVFDATKVTE